MKRMPRMMTASLYQCLNEWLDYRGVPLHLKNEVTVPVGDTTTTVTVVSNEDIMQWLADHAHWKFIWWNTDLDTNDPIPEPYYGDIVELKVRLARYYARHNDSVVAFLTEILNGHNPLESGWMDMNTTRTFTGFGYSDTKERYNTGNTHSSRARPITFSSGDVTLGDLSDGNGDWLMKTHSESLEASGSTNTQGQVASNVGYGNDGKLSPASLTNGTEVKNTQWEGSFTSTSSSPTDSENPVARQDKHEGSVGNTATSGAVGDSTQTGASNTDGYEYEHINHTQEGTDNTETNMRKSETDMIQRFLEYYNVDFVDMFLNGFLREYCYLSDVEYDEDNMGSEEHLWL